MNKKLMLALGGVFLLLVTLAILDYLGFFEKKPEEVEKAPQVVLGDARYVPMPRPFVFNLRSGSRVHTVQIKAQLLVRGASNEQMALDHIPLIEDTMITAFGQAQFDVLLTQGGKEELRQDTLLAVQNAMQAIVGQSIVEKVLFTGFVMQ